MKKLLLPLLSILFIGCFIGCGADDSATSSALSSASSSPETSSPETSSPETSAPETSAPEEGDTEGETPITYTITYDLGIEKNNPSVKIYASTQTVVYGESYVLYTPTEDVNEFDGWKRKDTGEIFEDGVYTLTKDITLVAQWIEYSITV